MYTVQQAQIKQGWSLLATLHCVLLPDKVAAQGGAKSFKRPQVEMMARRWQHQCLEVRKESSSNGTSCFCNQLRGSDSLSDIAVLVRILRTAIIVLMSRFTNYL